MVSSPLPRCLGGDFSGELNSSIGSGVDKYGLNLDGVTTGMRCMGLEGTVGNTTLDRLRLDLRGPAAGVGSCLCVTGRSRSSVLSCDDCTERLTSLGSGDVGRSSTRESSPSRMVSCVSGMTSPRSAREVRLLLGCCLEGSVLRRFVGGGDASGCSESRELACLACILSASSARCFRFFVPFGGPILGGTSTGASSTLDDLSADITSLTPAVRLKR